MDQEFHHDRELPVQAMSKRQHEHYSDYHELRHHGWEIATKQDHISPNSGSETTEHLIYKTVAAKVLIDAGYRVASEVSHDDRGEIDILGYGHPDRRMVAVEIERKPTDATTQGKLDQYIHGTPVEELFIFTPDRHDGDLGQFKEHMQDVMGL